MNNNNPVLQAYFLYLNAMGLKKSANRLKDTFFKEKETLQLQAEQRKEKSENLYSLWDIYRTGNIKESKTQQLRAATGAMLSGAGAFQRSMASNYMLLSVPNIIASSMLGGVSLLNNIGINNKTLNSIAMSSSNFLNTMRPISNIFRYAQYINPVYAATDISMKHLMGTVGGLVGGNPAIMSLISPYISMIAYPLINSISNKLVKSVVGGSISKKHKLKLKPLTIDAKLHNASEFINEKPIQEANEILNQLYTLDPEQKSIDPVQNAQLQYLAEIATYTSSLPILSSEIINNFIKKDVISKFTYNNNLSKLENYYKGKEYRDVIEKHVDRIVHGKFAHTFTENIGLAATEFSSFLHKYAIMLDPIKQIQMVLGGQNIKNEIKKFDKTFQTIEQRKSAIFAKKMGIGDEESYVNMYFSLTEDSQAVLLKAKTFEDAQIGLLAGIYEFSRLTALETATIRTKGYGIKEPVKYNVIGNTDAQAKGLIDWLSNKIPMFEFIRTISNGALNLTSIMIDKLIPNEGRAGRIKKPIQFIIGKPRAFKYYDENLNKLYEGFNEERYTTLFERISEPFIDKLNKTLLKIPVLRIFGNKDRLTLKERAKLKYQEEMAKGLDAILKEMGLEKLEYQEMYYRYATSTMPEQFDLMVHHLSNIASFTYATMINTATLSAIFSGKSLILQPNEFEKRSINRYTGRLETKEEAIEFQKAIMKAVYKKTVETGNESKTVLFRTMDAFKEMFGIYNKDLNEKDFIKGMVKGFKHIFEYEKNTAEEIWNYTSLMMYRALFSKEFLEEVENNENFVKEILEGKIDSGKLLRSSGKYGVNDFTKNQLVELESQMMRVDVAKITAPELIEFIKNNNLSDIIPYKTIELNNANNINNAAIHNILKQMEFNNIEKIIATKKLEFVKNENMAYIVASKVLETMKKEKILNVTANKSTECIENITSVEIIAPKLVEFKDKKDNSAPKLLEYKKSEYEEGISLFKVLESVKNKEKITAAANKAAENTTAKTATENTAAANKAAEKTTAKTATESTAAANKAAESTTAKTATENTAAANKAAESTTAKTATENTAAANKAAENTTAKTATENTATANNAAKDVNKPGFLKKAALKTMKFTTIISSKILDKVGEGLSATELPEKLASKLTKKSRHITSLLLDKASEKFADSSLLENSAAKDKIIKILNKSSKFITSTETPDEIMSKLTKVTRITSSVLMTNLADVLKMVTEGKGIRNILSDLASTAASRFSATGLPENIAKRYSKLARLTVSDLMKKGIRKFAASKILENSAVKDKIVNVIENLGSKLIGFETLDDIVADTVKHGRRFSSYLLKHFGNFVKSPADYAPRIVTSKLLNKAARGLKSTEIPELLLSKIVKKSRTTTASLLKKAAGKIATTDLFQNEEAKTAISEILDKFGDKLAATEAPEKFAGIFTKKTKDLTSILMKKAADKITASGKQQPADQATDKAAEQIAKSSTEKVAEVTAKTAAETANETASKLSTHANIIKKMFSPFSRKQSADNTIEGVKEAHKEETLDIEKEQSDKLSSIEKVLKDIRKILSIQLSVNGKKIHSSDNDSDDDDDDSGSLFDWFDHDKKDKNKNKNRNKNRNKSNRGNKRKTSTTKKIKNWGRKLGNFTKKGLSVGKKVGGAIFRTAGNIISKVDGGAIRTAGGFIRTAGSVVGRVGGAIGRTGLRLGASLFTRVAPFIPEIAGFLSNPVGLAIAGAATIGALGYGLYNANYGREKALIDKLEQEGIVEHNFFGDSKIIDWETVRKLPLEQLTQLLAFDDWSDEDKKALQELVAQKTKEKTVLDVGRKNVLKNQKEFHKFIKQRDEEMRDKEGFLGYWLGRGTRFLRHNIDGIVTGFGLFGLGSSEDREFYEKLEDAGIITYSTVPFVESEIRDWNAITKLNTDQLKSLLKLNWDDDTEKQLKEILETREKQKMIAKTRANFKNTLKNQKDFDKFVESREKELREKQGFLGYWANKALRTGSTIIQTVATVGGLFGLGNAEDEVLYDKLERAGVINYSIIPFVESEIRDWDTITRLNPDQIKSLLKLNWDDKTKSYLKEILEVKLKQKQELNKKPSTIEKQKQELKQKQNTVKKQKPKEATASTQKTFSDKVHGIIESVGNAVSNISSNISKFFSGGRITELLDDLDKKGIVTSTSQGIKITDWDKIYDLSADDIKALMQYVGYTNNNEVKEKLQSIYTIKTAKIVADTRNTKNTPNLMRSKVDTETVVNSVSDQSPELKNMINLFETLIDKLDQLTAVTAAGHAKQVEATIQTARKLAAEKVEEISHPLTDI